MKRLSVRFLPSSRKLSLDGNDGFVVLKSSTPMTSFSAVFIITCFFCRETKRKNSAAPKIDTPTAAPAIAFNPMPFFPPFGVVLSSLFGSSIVSSSPPSSTLGFTGCDDFKILSVLVGSMVVSVNCNTPRSIEF